VDFTLARPSDRLAESELKVLQQLLNATALTRRRSLRRRRNAEQCDGRSACSTCRWKVSSTRRAETERLDKEIAKVRAEVETGATEALEPLVRRRRAASCRWRSIASARPISSRG
jgi:ferredoxin